MEMRNTHDLSAGATQATESVTVEPPESPILGLPLAASITNGTPLPSVSSITRSTTFSFAALMVISAPSLWAICRISSRRSTPMTVSAPAALATWVQFSPITTLAKDQDRVAQGDAEGGYVKDTAREGLNRSHFPIGNAVRHLGQRIEGYSGIFRETAREITPDGADVRVGSAYAVARTQAILVLSSTSTISAQNS